MKNILLIITSIIILNNSIADYMARVPLEINQGGSLPNGSIIIINGNSGNGSGVQCRGGAILTTRTFDISGNQYFSFNFFERDSNDIYGSVYYSSPVQNGTYSDSLTATHRYSIQNLEDTKESIVERPFPPENDTSFLSYEFYSICKEEIIGGSYGPKTCCDFYLES